IVAVAVIILVDLLNFLLIIFQFFKISALNLVFCVTVVFGNVSLKCLPVSFNQAISAMPFFTTIFLFKRQAYKVVQ
ncbi:hypothetical protein S83_067780, partial [Arachis hypogaea]